MVAWHEVPGNAHTEIRPVGNGVIGEHVECNYPSKGSAQETDMGVNVISAWQGYSVELRRFVWAFGEKINRRPQSYRSLRDGTTLGILPRHFMPGYHHAVPTGRGGAS